MLAWFIIGFLCARPSLPAHLISSSFAIIVIGQMALNAGAMDVWSVATVAAFLAAHQVGHFCRLRAMRHLSAGS